MKAILPRITGDDAEVNAFAVSSKGREKCRDKKMINFSLLSLELPFPVQIHFHIQHFFASRGSTNYLLHIEINLKIKLKVIITGKIMPEVKR